MPPVKDCDAGHCSLQLAQLLCSCNGERERGEGEMVPVLLLPKGTSLYGH